jgi:pSer/pThr/pTyr-binding forkhead associated (FHA) protein
MAVKLTISPPADASSKVVEFEEQHVTIGRSSRCDIRLPFRVVSGHHLTIHCEPSSGYQIRDEASTNGTLLDGQPLPAERDQRLTSGMRLEIVDLRIDVELVPTLGEGVPLDKTGTIVRQMLGEALLGHASQDSQEEAARFEILTGPSRGERIEIPDDLERGRIGAQPQADIRVTGLAEPVVICRHGDGFAVGPDEQADYARPPTLGDQPLTELCPLSTGDTLCVGGVRMKFVDPLESYLRELDGLVPASPPDTDTADVEADGGAEPDRAQHEEASTASAVSDEASPTDSEQADAASAGQARQRWGLLEVGAIAVSLTLLAGVLLLLSSIFGLV